MMINREMIMEELENRGYKVGEHDKIDNGLVLSGVIIRTGEVSPIVYVNSYIEEAKDCDLSVEEVVDKMLSVLDTETPKIDMSQLTNPDFILSNVYIGLQKKSDEALLKRETEYEGIEAYLYVNVTEDATFKLMKCHLKMIGISEEEAWESAESNTKEGCVIKTMREMVMAKMPWMDEDDLFDFPFVVTNETTFRGAASIFAKEKIGAFLKEKGIERVAMLPSSIHEVMLMPIEDEEELEGLSEMVREITLGHVLVEEALSYRAYEFKIA